MVDVRGPGAGQSPPRSLLSLPPNLLINILSMLPPASLASVARVCLRLRVLVSSDAVYIPRLEKMGLWNPEEHSPASRINAAKEKVASVLKTKIGGLPVASLVTDYVQNSNSREDDYESDNQWKEMRLRETELEKLREANERGIVSRVMTTGSAINPNQAAKPTADVEGANPRHSARFRYREQHTELAKFYVDLRTTPVELQRYEVYRANQKDLEGCCRMLVRLARFSWTEPTIDNELLASRLSHIMKSMDLLLLAKFEEASKADRTTEMAACANAEYILNGGLNCANYYLSQSPLFYDPKLNPSLAFVRLHHDLDKAATGGANLASLFRDFMEKILETLHRQSDQIDEVFPAGVPTLVLFVNRLFQESILEYLEKTLTAAHKLEVGLYVETLATCVKECTLVLEFIIQKATASVAAKLGDRQKDPSLESLALTGVDAKQQNKVAVPRDLVRIVESVSACCRPFAVGYLDAEMLILRSAYKREFDRWRETTVGVQFGRPSDTPVEAFTQKKLELLTDGQRQNRKTHYVELTRKLIAQNDAKQSPVRTPLDSQSVGSLFQGTKVNAPCQSLQAKDGCVMEFPVPGQEGNTPSSLAGVERVVSIDQPASIDSADAPLYAPTSTLVSPEVCLSLIKANREAVRRCQLVMAATGETGDEIEQGLTRLFLYLLDSIANLHIKPAMDRGLQYLTEAKIGMESISDSALSFFELVHVNDIVMQMVDFYYRQEVAPYIDESNFLGKIVASKKGFEKQLDDLVAAGLDQTVTNLVHQIEFILSSLQSPYDFYPELRGYSSDKAINELLPTAACQKVTACLNEYAQVFMGATDQATLEVFLAEIGVRFFSVLVKHLKLRRISQAGSFQLICDLNRYYTWAASIKNDQLTSLFTVVKELGNAYIVSTPQDVKNLLSDAQRFQGQLRVEELEELLQSRSDYSQIRSQLEGYNCLIS